MDFETKLNKELPWSQKFREESCHEHTSYHDHLGTSVSSGRIAYHVLHADYCWENGGVIVNARRLISLDKKFKQKEKDIILYQIVRKGQILLSRFGGPAGYVYKNGLITNTYYFINGKLIKPGAYWIKITKRSNIYKQKKRGNVLYFKSKLSGVPYPYSYSLRHKRLIWKLNGKKVTVSEFWKDWEQRFVGLRQ